MAMTLNPDELFHDQLHSIYRGHSEIELDARCWPRVERSRQVVLDVLEGGKTVYGVNTGFGWLASKRISPERLDQLQLNLVRSHSAGTGPLLDDAIVRLVMTMKAVSLAKGFSGVRPVVIEALIRCVNHGLIPCIPSRGSVGASGDLAPLAHLALALIGEGRFRIRNEEIEAANALQVAGLEPLRLSAKEGIALLNGTQVSTALGLAAFYDAVRIFDVAVAAGALSVDAALGSDTPFDDRIHQLRNQPWQTECARRYRMFLKGSEIRASHADCDRVQDPYSLRCQPQVMGACRDLMEHAGTILLRESYAVSDNPLVFSDDGAILSGGNFHAQPVAFACDQLALAIAEIGSLAERRLSLLIDQHLSQLPPFLTEDGGMNSGFMIPQVTAAALVNENKCLAYPPSVDSLPTSANQEDHVSMATYAALRLQSMNSNLATIVAIELMAACQGIDFRKPLKTSPALSRLHAAVRQRVAFFETDRVFAPEIETVKQLILRGELEDLVRPVPKDNSAVNQGLGFPF